MEKEKEIPFVKKLVYPSFQDFGPEMTLEWKEVGGLNSKEILDENPATIQLFTNRAILTRAYTEAIEIPGDYDPQPDSGDEWKKLLEPDGGAKMEYHRREFIIRLDRDNVDSVEVNYQSSFGKYVLTINEKFSTGVHVSIGTLDEALEIFDVLDVWLNGDIVAEADEARSLLMEQESIDGKGE